MNRIEKLFSEKSKDILNIYFTAGYPNLSDTTTIIRTLASAGVDLIEIGMPYSDPLADGETIQASSQIALKNGMQLDILFGQIEAARQVTDVPLILMGYFNQVMQYGEVDFFKKCKAVGIDGLILPDLPIYEYETLYKAHFEALDLGISFLITPQTGDERIRKVDELTRGFVYMVSSASITGGTQSGISEEQLTYFNRINDMQLKHPRLIGFGISDHQSFSTACNYADGAIIGSAFIRALTEKGDLEEKVNGFVQKILN